MSQFLEKITIINSTQDERERERESPTTFLLTNNDVETATSGFLKRKNQITAQRYENFIISSRPLYDQNEYNYESFLPKV